VRTLLFFVVLNLFAGFAFSQQWRIFYNFMEDKEESANFELDTLARYYYRHEELYNNYHPSGTVKHIHLFGEERDSQWRSKLWIRVGCRDEYSAKIFKGNLPPQMSRQKGQQVEIGEDSRSGRWKDVLAQIHKIDPLPVEIIKRLKIIFASFKNTELVAYLDKLLINEEPLQELYGRLESVCIACLARGPALLENPPSPQLNLILTQLWATFAHHRELALHKT
jgi:hypothetical protein